MKIAERNGDSKMAGWVKTGLKPCRGRPLGLWRELKSDRFLVGRDFRWIPASGVHRPKNQHVLSSREERDEAPILSRKEVLL